MQDIEIPMYLTSVRMVSRSGLKNPFVWFSGGQRLSLPAFRAALSRIALEM